MIGNTCRMIKWTQRPSGKNLPNDKNSSALYGKAKAVCWRYCSALGGIFQTSEKDLCPMNWPMSSRAFSPPTDCELNGQRPTEQHILPPLPFKTCDQKRIRARQKAQSSQSKTTTGSRSSQRKAPFAAVSHDGQEEHHTKAEDSTPSPKSSSGKQNLGAKFRLNGFGTNAFGSLTYCLLIEHESAIPAKLNERTKYKIPCIVYTACR